MYLDNQLINRKAYYEARDLLIAGMSEGLSYNYPTFAASQPIHVSCAKANCFVVSSDNGDVEFKSETVIILKTGFKAERGSIFWAHISEIPVCDITDGNMLIWKTPNDIDDEAKLKNSINLNAIIVYPNPSTGDVFIELPKQGEYKVYNQIGQVIKQINISESGLKSIKLTNFASGMYYLVYSNRVIKPVKFSVIK